MNPHYPHFLNLYPGFKDVDYFCPKYTQFTNANSFFHIIHIIHNRRKPLILLGFSVFLLFHFHNPYAIIHSATHKEVR